MRGSGWTRRAFLFVSVAALHARGRVFPSARHQFVDASTECEVERLTNPANSSFLPPSHLRCVSRRRFLLFWSDRTGSPQAFQLDLRNWQSRQLTDARELEGSSLALLPGDETFAYFDGPSLKHSDFKRLKEREVYRVRDGWQRGKGMGVAADGSAAAFVEVRGGVSEIRLVPLRGGEARTVLERPGIVSDPMPRPGAEQLLYRDEAGALWLTDYAAGQNRALAVLPGTAGPACWGDNGKTVLYLSVPAEPGRPVSLAESDPEAGTAQALASTSKYASFAANPDATVFIGASGSLASPYLLLLVRATRRELSLCEHRASRPATVSPVFAPDSQRVFFVSDRHGKPAIYSVSLDKLVEPT